MISDTFIISEWTDATVPLTKEGQNSWFNEKKYNLGLDFPNLPYLIDGDVKLTQSLAIMRYLGRKFGLSPSEADIAKGDLFEQYLMEVKIGLARVCYTASPEIFEEKKADFLSKLPLRVEEVGKFIGDGPYALGEKITYVDFLALEFLDCLAIFSPEHFQSGPVVDYINRMKNLPALKKFFDSDDCTHKSYCIHGPQSQWPGWPNKQ